MTVVDTFFSDRPVVIGHSVGGMVTSTAATWHDTQFAAVSIIDTAAHKATSEDLASRDKVAFGPRKIWASREDMLAQFRVVPAQDSEPYILDHGAQNSVREEDGGWAWKFDAASSLTSRCVPTAPHHARPTHRAGDRSARSAGCHRFHRVKPHLSDDRPPPRDLTVRREIPTTR